MAQWLPFLTVAVFVLVAVLVLSRLSQRAIQEQDDRAVNQDRSETALHASPDSETETAGQASPNIENSQHVELTAGMLHANLAVTQGLVISILLAAAWYFSIPARAFGVTGDQASTGVVAVLGGLVFGLALWTANEISTALADAVGAAYDEVVRELLAPATKRGWAVLFGGVLPLIAISEELLFRAALIGVPNATFEVSVWLFAVASSIAFALGHGAQGRVGVVVTGVLGFVLAAGYILSGSLLVVIVAHYVINAMEFIVHEYFQIEDFSFDIATSMRG